MKDFKLVTNRAGKNKGRGSAFTYSLPGCHRVASTNPFLRFKKRDTDDAKKIISEIPPKQGISDLNTFISGAGLLMTPKEEGFT